MRVVSVDLAYSDYRDFGMVTLNEGASGATYEALPFADGRAHAPTPEHVADVVIDLCTSKRASLILLDGPQGWKDPSNGLTHSRLCERALNAPGKTGLPGNAKPANYLPFIAFSISVFDAFQARGWPRYDPAAWRPGLPAVVETLPLAAWRSLQLPCLPAKKKSRDGHMQKHLKSLVDAGLVAADGPPLSHDQLQALVAGLAGLGITARTPHRYKVVGGPPALLEGAWREGYIVNPARAPRTDNN